MNKDLIKTLLNKVQNQSLTVQEALKKLEKLPYEDLTFAKVDHHRSIRRGFSEVIYGEGKSKEEILKIIHLLAKKQQPVLVTRVESKKASWLRKKNPKLKYHSKARLLTMGKMKKKKGSVGVLAAGTSDQNVAEEAVLSLEHFGIDVFKSYDVGVAGIHRLFDQLDHISQCSVLIVVAGIEGALPSVVAGLVDKPVIGVPTSIGYGASFSGVSALLSMLNSCSGGIGVVNIDNGFGAAYLAALIINSISHEG